MPKPSILMAESDPAQARTAGMHLESDGFRVCCESTGAALCRRVLAEPPDLVILETVLADMSGFDACKHIRPRYNGGILFHRIILVCDYRGRGQMDPQPLPGGL